VIEIKWLLIMMSVLFLSMFGMISVTEYAEERTKQECLRAGNEIIGDDCVRRKP